MNKLKTFGVLTSAVFLAGIGCHHRDTCPDSGLVGPPLPFLSPSPGPGVMAMPLPKGDWQPNVPPAPAPIGSFGIGGDPGYPQSSALKPAWAPSVRLYPPEVIESPETTKKTESLQPDPGVPPKPPAAKVDEQIKPMAPALALPVGIAQFTLVKERVANGLRPSLEDGLDWLAANGYKTVLYVHEPSTSEAADRKQVEKRGLTFVNVEVSPSTLTRQKADEFNKTVGEASSLPLFVYDRDGSLTGAMWYLHFRLAQAATDEFAREQARPLGLSEDRGGVHAEMFEAARRLAQGEPH